MRKRSFLEVVQSVNCKLVLSHNESEVAQGQCSQAELFNVCWGHNFVPIHYNYLYLGKCMLSFIGTFSKCSILRYMMEGRRSTSGLIASVLCCHSVAECKWCMTSSGSGWPQFSSGPASSLNSHCSSSLVGVPPHPLVCHAHVREERRKGRKCVFLPGRKFSTGPATLSSCFSPTASHQQTILGRGLLFV